MELRRMTFNFYDIEARSVLLIVGVIVLVTCHIMSHGRHEDDSNIVEELF